MEIYIYPAIHTSLNDVKDLIFKLAEQRTDVQALHLVKNV